MAQFLYQFTPGERPELGAGPEAWTDDDERIAAEHVAYLERGAADGIVVMAGRCQDWVGPAIVVLDAESEDDARRFMEQDPFVLNGLFRANLHPFKVAIRRDR